MGGRGAFLESGGFSKYRYRVVDIVDGVKVLEPLDDRAEHGVPERSNEPCTSYMCYYKKKDKNGNKVFKQLIVFDENRMPIYRIDYGPHQSTKKTLHVHYYKDGDITPGVEYLHQGDELYEKHKNLFKGVELWELVL